MSVDRARAVIQLDLPTAGDPVTTYSMVRHRPPAVGMGVRVRLRPRL
jgi:hypothetical protein